MKKCPNCGKIYRDFDQYCLVCRYKLKYIEGTEKIEYCPEPTGSKYTDPKPSKPTVVCPYCKSTNVHKISTTAKVTNTVLFGIFGTKRHKQFHCNNCKADF